VKDDVKDKVDTVATSLPAPPKVVRKQILLTPEDEVKFTAAFDLLDADGDGEIESGELHALMTKLGYTPHDDDIADLIALADQNDNGTINLREVLQLMVGAIKDKALKTQYIAQFKLYDKNENGLISADEILRVTHILTPDAGVPDDEIQTLIGLADTNGDGQVDYDEYVHMIMDKEKYLHYNFDFMDDVLNITNNVWLLMDDPSELDFDEISESKYWNVKRYWKGYTAAFLVAFMCCAYGRLHRHLKARRRAAYKTQIDDSKTVGTAAGSYKEGELADFRSGTSTADVLSPKGSLYPGKYSRRTNEGR
jgi:calmodulin